MAHSRSEAVRGDREAMARALRLARAAVSTSPNPKVGAVIVRDGAVLGEGYHRGAGQPHAEIEALGAARAAGADVRGATMYVNLEPCVHTGRTPPCAPQVAEAGIARVVIAHADPDPRVSGRGIALLRERGVGVTTGVLEDDARLLNLGFLTRVSTGRPLVSLKLAQSLDGRLAAPDGTSRWLTGPQTRALVHARRLEVDAVMVGAGTAVADDPALTVRALPPDHAHRNAPVRQPLRVVVDPAGRTPPDARALRGGGIVAATARLPHERATAYKEAGAEVLTLPEGPGGVDLAALLAELGRRGLNEVLCEGGARLAASLLRQRLVGRLELHYAPVVLGGGLAVGPVATTLAEAPRWRVVSVQRSGDDFVVTAVAAV